MTLSVYLASRFSRKDELNEYRTQLEAHGIGVTSRWLTGSHEFTGIADDDIPPHHNARFAAEDLEDIDRADVIVCFTEAKGAGKARGGRHVEAGYALAKRKPLVVVGYRENVFYCLPTIVFCETWDGALQVLINAVASATEPAGVLS